VLEFLFNQTDAISVEELKKSLNCSLSTIRALERRKILSIEMVNIRRDPLSHFRTTTVLPPVLASSQRTVWEQMEADWDNKDNNDPLVFLLFGVTGSGKTEIYLKALDKVVAMGRRGICLVPEIALTPQTVERFAARYPGRVGILHSNLSAGEQYDEWQWIKDGNCDVVIGPRSALFAPQPDIGLIILDEEHGQMYKQQDRSPRYHSREVAIRLAQLNNAVVILGSATPDVASFYKAQSGKYKLMTLTKRITSHAHTQIATKSGKPSLPPVTYSTQPAVDIVDMKKELKAGNVSLLSRSLLAEMRKTLEQNDQIILFLNRRGTATFVQCPNCGFVFCCPRCSVALTYHSQRGRLICHHCRYSISVPDSCPRCSDVRLLFLGIGTQKVADEVRRAFPTARLLRWDSDVTGQRYKHEELLNDFRAHRADILIGTQMIAKGLDLPQVTLAGIISADTSINLPDFRAGEHTFQLLCQVAGRAGRGFKAGKVIIQTYSPENYAIQAVAKHDYLGFYRYEISYRRQYNYPPFSQLVRLVYSHTNNELCQQELKRLSQSLISKIQTMGENKLSLIGPVPAFIHRVRGRYRWQLIIRGHNPASLLSGITLSAGWTIDVDPVGVA
jgi:primosomal protein N' (replication factor Y)